MIVSSKSNHVVLLGVEVRGTTMVCGAAYVNASRNTRVKLFDITGPQPVDLGFWRIPDVEFDQGMLLPSFVLEAEKVE